MLPGLRLIRENLKISRKEAARRCEVSASFLWRLEEQRFGAGFSTLHQISKGLNVPVSQLLGERLDRVCISALQYIQKPQSSGPNQTDKERPSAITTSLGAGKGRAVSMQTPITEYAAEQYTAEQCKIDRVRAARYRILRDVGFDHDSAWTLAGYPEVDSADLEAAALQAD